MDIQTIQQKEHLKQFLIKRKVATSRINKGIDRIKEKIDLASRKNDGVLLLSVKLEKIFVGLSKEVIENFFPNQKNIYPADGLLLDEIQIIHHEYIDKHSFDPGYTTKLVIRFVFNKKEFNHRFGFFPLDQLSFHDEDLRIVNNTMGICIDPTFKNKEQYARVKDALIKIQKNLLVLY